MKILTAALVVLFVLACRQDTETVVSDTGTTSTTTVSATVPEVDTAAVETAARDAAHETGTALETAGKELQEEAKTDTK